MQVGMLSKNIGISPNLKQPDRKQNYGLFCFEGANEHHIEGASPHQGQKYSSKPKYNIDSSYNWYQERLKTMKASIANSVAGLVLEQAE